MTDSKASVPRNERLRQRETAIDQRISTALETERANLRRDQERHPATGNRPRVAGGHPASAGEHRQPGEHADLPVGLGLREGDAEEYPDGHRWHALGRTRRCPCQRRPAAQEPLSFPTRFGPAQRTLEQHDQKRSPMPGTPRWYGNRCGGRGGPWRQGGLYGAERSTLMGSVAMTALIGRVPIDGTVNDPYPFKVLVGPDNLTANGIDLPDVAGAVFSGTASGDWTLSCVRGQVRSITFVFNDGTIRTLPKTVTAGSKANNQQEGLGWISDPHGIPCVSGERRSNAQQYLGTQALIAAAGAGAASLIKSDSGQMSYVGSDGSIRTVGISGNEAMGRILASGVQEMSQWVQQALRPGVRSGFTCSPEPGGRPPRKTAGHRLRPRRPQGRSPRRRNPCLELD